MLVMRKLHTSQLYRRFKRHKLPSKVLDDTEKGKEYSNKCVTCA